MNPLQNRILREPKTKLPLSVKDQARLSQIIAHGEPTILGREYTIPAPFMVSAAGEQEKVMKYKRYQSQRNDKITDWLVGDVVNSADFVYCREQGNFISQGFGGSRLTFPIEGGSVELQGPWHGNADSFFAATGVDIRDKNHTQIVLGWEWGGGQLYTVKQVFWIDMLPELGPYNRCEPIAQAIANHYGRIVYGWLKSAGGGHSVEARP